MEISIEELYEIVNPNIIDIRTSYSYDKGNIPGAININERDLITNPERYLEKQTNYYLYCKEGLRSNKICLQLNAMGYKTFNIKGGYKEYLKK